ncbi:MULTISPECIES: hypothetical protein [Vagococcus]|uniref:Uncharacterized protein n=1 Tax=Vagococcus fluvialis bH819 TaxID=1255619 RepID=A0A1X6WKH3_9ENTE|nr:MULTISPECIES: hypothetical protein [Vagococcus]SLM84831.1 hypothetical protein FM121_01970 [Vagococcus fluvialis bH819]HCM89138.1 hypothetical protein [Vagococcus sp.]
MSNDNPYIPNPPTPASDSIKEVDKEIILKEKFSDELMRNLNSKNTDIILPDEIKIKERKKED